MKRGRTRSFRKKAQANHAKNKGNYRGNGKMVWFRGDGGDVEKRMKKDIGGSKNLL